MVVIATATKYELLCIWWASLWPTMIGALALLALIATAGLLDTTLCVSLFFLGTPILFPLTFTLRIPDREFWSFRVIAISEDYSGETASGSLSLSFQQAVGIWWSMFSKALFFTSVLTAILLPLSIIVAYSAFEFINHDPSVGFVTGLESIFVGLPIGIILASFLAYWFSLQSVKGTIGRSISGVRLVIQRY